jgi:hypothetical protein
MRFRWPYQNQLNRIEATQHAIGRRIMAKIDDVAAATAAQVDALELKIDETIFTLGELKALIGSGTTANAEAVLEAANLKLDTLLITLGAAEADADPTPDA